MVAVPKRSQGHSQRTGNVAGKVLQRHGHISFLLFSDGQADPEQWRPNADSSMWWGRRDALARITASALWATGDGGRRNGVAECSFLLAGDSAVLHMGPRFTEHVTPTERDLVRAWRRCITGSAVPGASCERDAKGQTATIIASSGRANDDAALEALERRDLLEYLQRQCALEFLRSHGLNKSVACLLKSVTKPQLIEVLRTLRTEARSQPATSVPAANQLSGALEGVLARQAPGTTIVVLHEASSVDLALFEGSGQKMLNASSALFVLGAVRDMTRAEVEAVVAAAKRWNLPVVHCRVGCVAEFTSKVVRCLAIAHEHDLVLPAVARAVASSSSKPEDMCNFHPLRLHVVAPLPFAADVLSVAPEVRAQMLPVVQLTVCALWRSKIGDALVEHRQVGIEPRLHLVFTDGIVLNLGESFVAELSQQHQAAPTERQVLDALVRKVLATATKSNLGGKTSRDAEDRGVDASCRVINRIVKTQRRLTMAALGLSTREEFEGLPNAALKESIDRARCLDALLLFLQVLHSRPDGSDTDTVGCHSAVARSCESHGIPFAYARVNGASAASAVTLVQFMHYTGRLHAAVRALTLESKPSLLPAANVKRKKRKRKASTMETAGQVAEKMKKKRAMDDPDG